jgi:hypothetical protein
LCGADYSHFDARYAFTLNMANPEMVRHMQWYSEAYGAPLTPEKPILDANRLLSEQRTFKDSRDSLGLQLADMLAAILRRALNDRLQISGWRDFGRLLVRKQKPGSITFNGNSQGDLGTADDRHI